jgi:hypothetical protein
MRTFILGIGAIAMVVGSVASCGATAGFDDEQGTGEGGGGGGPSGITGSAGPPAGGQGEDGGVVPLTGWADGACPGIDDDGGEIDSSTKPLPKHKGGSDSGGAGGTSGHGGLGPLKSCHEAAGSAPLEICGVVSSNIPGFTCPTKYISKGPCPSASLIGCCITKVSVGEYESDDGVCYYSAVSAKIGEAFCTGDAVTWVTKFP